MPEKFISWPVSALDGNNLPTTMTGALLHDTTSLTGLTNGVARRTFVLQNPSPSFTPSVAFGVTVADSYGVASGGGMITHTRTNVALGAEVADREFIVTLSAHFLTVLPAATDWTCSVNGEAAGNAVFTYRPTRFASHFVWRVSVPSGTTGSAVISRTAGTSSLSAFSVNVFRLTGNPTLDTAGAVTATNTTQNEGLTLTQNVAEGAFVFGGVAFRNSLAVPTWTGLTGNNTVGGSGGGGASVASASGASAGSRTMTIAVASETTNNDKSAYSLELAA